MMCKILLLLILLIGLVFMVLVVMVKIIYCIIFSWDGMFFGVFVIEFQDVGSGCYLLLVMFSSWVVFSVEYVGVVQLLVQCGYVVISYSLCGFWEFGGSIDIVGFVMVEDVSVLIDWVLDNICVDFVRIGVFGIFYGVGISLLVVVCDLCIKVVVVLSGWVDLQVLFYSYDMFSVQGIVLLVVVGLVIGCFGVELVIINGNVLVGNYQGVVDLLLLVVVQCSLVSSFDEINVN